MRPLRKGRGGKSSPPPLVRSSERAPPSYCNICDIWYRDYPGEEHIKTKRHDTNHRTLQLLSEKTGETIDELAAKRFGYE